MDNAIESTLEERWGGLKRQHQIGEILWINYRSTPAFPSTWPPDASLQLIHYVYAYGNYSDVSLPLVDGEFISTPWARIRKNVGNNGRTTVELLEDDLRQIGIQGFRPLNEAELAIFEKADQIEKVFALWVMDGKPNDTQTLRIFYQTWLSLNGVVAGQIRKSHTAFFDWLEQEK